VNVWIGQATIQAFRRLVIRQSVRQSVGSQFVSHEVGRLVCQFHEVGQSVSTDNTQACYTDGLQSQTLCNGVLAQAGYYELRYFACNALFMLVKFCQKIMAFE
jgi:hypothetical protein